MREIVELSIGEYKGYKVNYDYVTDSYYEVIISSKVDGFEVSFVKNRFSDHCKKSFVGELFRDHWNDPSAYGYFDGKQLVAVIEVEREHRRKRLRITNISVDKDYRRNNLGTLLMDKAKSIAMTEHFRAIILETQTFNTKAIEFYLSQGFTLGGFDSSCYSNEDIEKNEVRIELVHFL